MMKQTSIVLADDDKLRAERVKDATGFGMSRSAVLREAVLIGLSALEQRYGLGAPAKKTML